MVNLTNRMWFSVVCTLNNNDMRCHGGQNVVDSQGAVSAFFKWNEDLKIKTINSPVH